MDTARGLRRIQLFVLAAAAVAPGRLAGQARDSVTPYSPADCPSCAEWNRPAAPARVFANVHYVGTNGLASLLLTSDAGHILLDGGLPESAPLIVANIRALGFRVEDIRAIVNSHAHYDHAGGISLLQRISGAAVAASAASAPVLRTGRTGPDDPQHAIALPFPPVNGVRVIGDRDTVRGGDLVIVAQLTPGHTPGGTSWSWRSCEGTTCLDFVYADSQTPVSADGFLFTRNTTYPGVLADFERGLTRLEQLPCDVLITPHPGASRFWQRLAATGNAPGLRDPEACRGYAARAREALARRVAAEQR